MTLAIAFPYSINVKYIYIRLFITKTEYSKDPNRQTDKHYN